MDQLQVLRLPSMAKFSAGFLQCNQSFELECVGPSKANYEQRMTKVRHTRYIVFSISWFVCLFVFSLQNMLVSKHQGLGQR